VEDIMTVTRNMGTVDRLVRAVLGVVLIAALLSGVLSGTPGVLAGIVGAVFIVTAGVRFCPLYRLVGVSTCDKLLRTH
jgi:hypothetical protein